MDAIADSKSGRTCFWGTGDAGGEPDHPNDWVDPGEGEDWVEEFGLQLGSILCIAESLKARSTPQGQRGPKGLL